MSDTLQGEVEKAKMFYWQLMVSAGGHDGSVQGFLREELCPRLMGIVRFNELQRDKISELWKRVDWGSGFHSVVAKPGKGKSKSSRINGDHLNGGYRPTWTLRRDLDLLDSKQLRNRGQGAMILARKPRVWRAPPILRMSVTLECDLQPLLTYPLILILNEIMCFTSILLTAPTFLLA